MFFLYLLRLVSTGSSTILSVLGHVAAMQHFQQGFLISFCLCLDLLVKSLFYLNSVKILSKTNSYKASLSMNFVSIVATLALAFFSSIFSSLITKGYEGSNSFSMLGYHVPLDVVLYLFITLSLSLYGSMNALTAVSMDLLSTKYSRNTKVNISNIQGWLMRIDSFALAICLLVVAFFQLSSTIAYIFAACMHLVGMVISYKNKKKLLENPYQEGEKGVSIKESLKLSFQKMKDKDIKLLAVFSFLSAYASSLLWVGMVFLIISTIHNNVTAEENLLWLRISFSVTMLAVITVITRKIDSVHAKWRNFIMMFSGTLACSVLFLVYRYKFDYSIFIIFFACITLFVAITTFRFVQRKERQKLLTDEEYLKTTSFFVSLETLGHLCSSLTVGMLGEKSMHLFIVLILVSFLYLIYHKYSSKMSRYFKIFLPKI